MKDKLLNWAEDQVQLDIVPSFVLYKLAQFADGECCAWAAIAVLARAVRKSERTVQYALRELETGGLIEKTDRTHRLAGTTRSVPVYQLAPGVAGLDVRAVKAVDRPGDKPGDKSVSMGAKSAPIDPHGCKNDGGMGATYCTRIEPKEPTSEEANAPSEGAGAGASDGVGGDRDLARRVFDGLPDAMRVGVSSWRQFEAAWMAELRRSVDPQRLGPAVAAYGRTPSAWGASGRPMAAHRLIEQGRYDAFLDLPAAVAVSAAPAPADTGLPDGLWAAVVEAKGAAFAASYLAGCAWCGERRSLTARTGTAYERLRDGCGAVFATFEVTLTRPGSAGAAAREVQLGETV